ncbi:MAG: hypothetical protein EOP04_02870 [Proteobacteria bacterium]|nr:MAG: hypothetical protein EOP04_02870 [Pseudomonadota bacterium]
MQAIYDFGYQYKQSALLQNICNEIAVIRKNYEFPSSSLDLDHLRDVANCAKFVSPDDIISLITAATIESYQLKRGDELKVLYQELKGVRSQCARPPLLVDLTFLQSVSEMETFIAPNEIIKLVNDTNKEINAIIESFWIVVN